MASEFDLIRMIAHQAGACGDGVAEGIGDDAAVLKVPAGHELVVTTDTLNAGVHFFEDASPRELGHKCLAVNLSDLAAMGAQPKWVLLSLTLPRADEGWLRQFTEGFLALAERHGVSLVGGDTCAGPLALTVTALGVVSEGQALLRSAAQPGNLVVVSGSLGRAGLALDLLKNGGQAPPGLLDALNSPQPRVALGQALVGKATACIDLSDGLLADLGHVTSASGCGAEIELGTLPGAEELDHCSLRQRWELQLTAGDDYELCFTWPESDIGELEVIRQSVGVGLTVIGRIVDGTGIRCLTPEGDTLELTRQGHEHFQ